MKETSLTKESQWKDHLIFLGILFGLAVWFNRGIEIKGLYMDDLYFWSCYGEQSFFEYIFPIGSTRFRFLYYLAAWFEMLIVGNRVSWFVPINILLNTGVAWSMYAMGRRLAGSKTVGFFVGTLYLASRMAYYQIGQVLGLMETMALWMGIAILWQLYQYLNKENGEKHFCLASLLYFGVCFVHERYMALFPLLLLVLLMKKSKQIVCWASVVLSFALMQAIRFFTIGSVLPAGTGRTQVKDTFSVAQAIRHALSEVAYVFGINAGPDYLNGLPWAKNPLAIKAMILLADLAILALVLGFLGKWLAQKDKKVKFCQFANAVLFVGFIALTICAACVTIRVEMRWIYVSFAAALLFLAWLYGQLTLGLAPAFYLKRLRPWGMIVLAYVILMVPVECYMRQNAFPNIYFFPEQKHYNSLAEVTKEKYGDIEGKRVYIIGNSYDVSEFDAKTFFKVYQKNSIEQLTPIYFIDSVWDIGLVTDDMIVLEEDTDHGTYIDITQAVRNMKLSVKSGYYPKDHWMDEHGSVEVIAGETGLIKIQILFPGVMEGGEVITIEQVGGETLTIPLKDSVVETQIQATPWEHVTLNFSYNFYMQNAGEQRGEERLAALVYFEVE